MRYISRGAVHKDFHRLLCATCRYLVENFGAEALDSVVEKMAKDVYKTMHESLKAGDCSELCEFWEYYFAREGGDCTVEEVGSGVRLTVRKCPAQEHLRSLEGAPDPIMCIVTEKFNKALAEDTPYAAETRRTGEFSCIQELILKEKGGR